MHVFFSYVQENRETIDDLVRVLVDYNVPVWLDRNDIPGGISWKEAIRKAIRHGDYFIACFSQEYEQKGRTYMNEELTLAIEEIRLRPRDTSWFIPIVLSGRVPDWDIGAGRTLRDIQWIDFAEQSWEKGTNKLLQALGKNQEREESGSTLTVSLSVVQYMAIHHLKLPEDIDGNMFYIIAQEILGLRYAPAIINIKRRKQLQGSIVPLYLEIDKTEITGILNDDYECYFVKPGNRTFQIIHYDTALHDSSKRTGSRSSKLIKKNIEPGIVYEFECYYPTGLFQFGKAPVLEEKI